MSSVTVKVNNDPDLWVKTNDNGQPSQSKRDHDYLKKVVSTLKEALEQAEFELSVFDKF